MNNIVKTGFLRTSREWPKEIDKLVVTIDKTYIEIADKVNSRTIGIYPTNRPAITGNGYFFSNAKQDSFRQIYPITASGSFPHNIDTKFVDYFGAIYGIFTDGTIWYSLPYVDVVNVTNQIALTVDSTNFIITPGAGTPPTISRGFVVLEWIARV